MSQNRMFPALPNDNNSEFNTPYKIECDAFNRRGADLSQYLNEKASFSARESSMREHYTNYSEYVCSVNILNAALNQNLEKVQEWMNKLGKNSDFKVLVDYCKAPLNPYAKLGSQSFGGCEAKSILEVITSFKTITPNFKKDCVELLENKFSPSYLKLGAKK